MAVVIYGASALPGLSAGLALLPAGLSSPEARVLLLAIAGQESGFRAQRQSGGGPAHGLLQFELSGIRGVMQHPASKDLLFAACNRLGIVFDAAAIRSALSDPAVPDALDWVLARLLLWTDPQALPAVGDTAGGWAYYLRCWRPGKPRKADWQQTWYPNAMELIK
jgi:hypothetical protein